MKQSVALINPVEDQQTAQKMLATARAHLSRHAEALQTNYYQEHTDYAKAFAAREALDALLADIEAIYASATRK